MTIDARIRELDFRHQTLERAIEEERRLPPIRQHQRVMDRDRRNRQHADAPAQCGKLAAGGIKLRDLESALADSLRD